MSTRSSQQWLWPVRHKPCEDELLSSWLVRLAHGHGLKVQTLCNLLFGSRQQVWNRDVDRLAPAWLIDALAMHTGTPVEQAYRCTLRVFEGTLYRQAKESGSLQWIQSLMMYHRTRTGFGQQFCPACLRSGSVAYFRKTWRTTLKTICLEHECGLQDRCARCQAAVSFHRIDMGKGSFDEASSIKHCHRCGFDLSETPGVAPAFYDCPEALDWLCLLVSDVDHLSCGRPHEMELGTMSVLHNLVHLMVSRTPTNHLQEYVAERIGCESLAIPGKGRIHLEALDVHQRHQLLLQAGWLMLDLGNRISQAWRDKAIRYNHLIKDLREVPNWFQQMVIDRIDRRPYTHRKPRRGRMP